MDDGIKIDVLGAHINIFRYCFVWPRKGKENDKYFNWKAAMLCPFYGLIGFGDLYHLVYNLYSRNNLEVTDIIEDCYITLGVLILEYITLCIIFKRTQISELVREIGNYSEFGIPNKADLVNRQTNLFVKFFSFYTSFACICYAFINGFWEMNICIETRTLRGSKNICGLMSNTWLPFEIDYSPLKQIYVVLQVVSALFSFNIGACTFCVLVGSSQLVAAKIDHLNELLEKSLKPDVFEEKKINLYFCIRYHQHIIGLVQQINKCFSPMLLIHISVVAIVISSVGYMFVMGHSVKHTVYLGGYLVVVYIACLAGQILLDKSDGINYAIYNTAWYNEDAQIQKDVAFMLLHSQRDLCLNAGGFGIMSYDTLKVILKTAYSYMALLNSTM